MWTRFERGSCIIRVALRLPDTAATQVTSVNDNNFSLLRSEQRCTSAHNLRIFGLPFLAHAVVPIAIQHLRNAAFRNTVHDTTRHTNGNSAQEQSATILRVCQYLSTCPCVCTTAVPLVMHPIAIVLVSSAPSQTESNAK